MIVLSERTARLLRVKTDHLGSDSSFSECVRTLALSSGGAAAALAAGLTFVTGETERPGAGVP